MVKPGDFNSCILEVPGEMSPGDLPLCFSGADV